MKKVIAYTDGSCLGNPGPGGYGVILEYNGKEKVISGGCESTTNNRMELSAVIAALSALNEPCEITIYSDSKYVVDTISKGWVFLWKSRNWVKSNKSKALNVDLWEELLPLLAKHKVDFIWVEGHKGNDKNERCDGLATSEALKFKK